MSILHHRENGLSFGQCGNEVENHFQNGFFVLEYEKAFVFGVALPDTKEIGDNPVIAGAALRRGEPPQTLDFSQPHVVVVHAFDTGSALDSDAERIKRALGVEGRAIIRQAGMLYAPQFFAELVNEPSLPMPGSPDRRTARPSPDVACSHRRCSSSISSRRPVKGVRC